ncbi:hypothetical protein NTGM5_30112 [Candidatus Nitrotoga sp. M5]|nr:hypothetical protein NTGM5_30112 [Candidatus Nitrotoga sp. M5]
MVFIGYLFYLNKQLNCLLSETDNLTCIQHVTSNPKKMSLINDMIIFNINLS